ncbi:MAG TPA: LPS assembly lipoprotein LptE [Sedimentisphaerales bacterium]|nr:LPS assembly lipoprotein LptE [Sedimentisphaerales bacterium]
MNKFNLIMSKYFKPTILPGVVSCVFAALFVTGCGGYSNEVLYPEEINTVYVEMFDSDSFYRGIEYELTDALAKRIEADTPYKVVSDRSKADTVIGGSISSAQRSVLTVERETGRAMEKEATLEAIVEWKNLKTGDVLISNKTVIASASYSEWQSQGFRYGYTLSANRLAEKIVELMEKPW